LATNRSTLKTPNFADKTIWTGDNLDVLRGMNSERVYLDTTSETTRNENDDISVGSTNFRIVVETLPDETCTV